MRFILIAVALATAATLAAQTAEHVTIDGAVGKLAAVIQRPVSAPGRQCDMVVLMHGFMGKKEGSIERRMADSLLRHGIGSIRFDFNGHGQSEGEFRNMTVPNEVEDALKVYEYLRRQPYVRTISFSGHSQGGVVAGMAAGLLGADKVATLTLLAPAAVLREDAIRGNSLGAVYNPLDPPEYVVMPNGLQLGKAYIQTAFALPIYETTARYRGPACMIHGTGDVVVPYTYSIRYREHLEAPVLHLIEGDDHGFTKDEARAVGLAVDFIRSTLKHRQQTQL